MKANNCRDARQAWMKLSREFDPTTGDFETRLHNKFSK